MSLTINHPEADELAQELSRYTGESPTKKSLRSWRLCGEKSLFSGES
jgi:hypothetical protein